MNADGIGKFLQAILIAAGCRWRWIRRRYDAAAYANRQWPGPGTLSREAASRQVAGDSIVRASGRFAHLGVARSACG